MKCDREQQVIEATRNGLWTSSLRDHLRHCALCTQTELIAASLRGDAVKAERLLDLPPAGMVWRRAQATRRERAWHGILRGFPAVGDIPDTAVRLPGVHRASRTNRARGNHGRSAVSNTSHCGIVCVGP
jgi:hypothetical protein